MGAGGNKERDGVENVEVGGWSGEQDKELSASKME